MCIGCFGNGAEREFPPVRFLDELCNAGDRFVFGDKPESSSISEEDLMACLSPRGSRNMEGGLSIVMLNSCNTIGLCERLSSAFPMLIGWDAHDVPGQQCTSMVRVESSTRTSLNPAC